MLRINYNIEIGSVQFKPASNSLLIKLHSQASMNAPVNYCRMVFTLPADLSMAVGDKVKVELGYDGASLNTVFSGVVTCIEWQTETVVLEAESLARQLKALHANAYFENAFAADIVKDLAAETDMATGRIEPGLRFAFYAVGSNRSAWDQISSLARQCGFDLYADSEDQLVFGSTIPGTPEMFQFGINILTLRVEERQEAVSGVEVFGESPASFGAGPDASAWFTKKDVKGSAGSDPKQRVYLPAARTQELAAEIAGNLWEAISPKKTGRLLSLGKSALVTGGSIMVSDMPVDHQNGTYKIIGVDHLVHPVKGYLTTMEIKEM
jgi:phage protein D